VRLRSRRSDEALGSFGTGERATVFLLVVCSPELDCEFRAGSRVRKNTDGGGTGFWRRVGAEINRLASDRLDSCVIPWALGLGGRHPGERTAPGRCGPLEVLADVAVGVVACNRWPGGEFDVDLDGRCSPTRRLQVSWRAVWVWHGSRSPRRPGNGEFPAVGGPGSTKLVGVTTTKPKPFSSAGGLFLVEWRFDTISQYRPLDTLSALGVAGRRMGDQLLANRRSHGHLDKDFVSQLGGPAPAHQP